MMEINIEKIKKNFGFSEVLNDFSLKLKTGEKVALIGPNGSGKSTIMKLIIKKEEPDEGYIKIRKDSTIGYLTQIPPKEKNTITAEKVLLRGVEELLDLEYKIEKLSNLNDDESIKKLSNLRDEFEIKGGYKLKEKISKVIHGFKLSEELLKINYNDLSGGEKTIINLASLILKNPDILLLDEPTNHLDIESLEWLEDYLKAYKGTILIISHDRFFLDNVIDRIVYINNGKNEEYIGNYSYYLQESEKRLLLLAQSYKNQQKEISSLTKSATRLREWGKRSDDPRFFRKARAIEKRIERMDKIEKPFEKHDLPIHLNTNQRSGNEVLIIKDLILNIENRNLFDKASLNIYYKEKVCFMGKNGSGKTTLIKEILKNANENIKIGKSIKLGYIPQEIIFDDEEIIVYDYIRSLCRLPEEKIRSKLYQFNFNEEDITKKLKKLSGGEKVRIKLLELILCNANFLILDEPTNHIDIETRELLEDALIEYDGTVLFISHDRYFINKIATKIIKIENKKIITYHGNYDYLKEQDNKKILDIPKKAIKKKDEINASNRIKDYIKETLINEVTISGSKTKVYRIRKKSKVFFLKIGHDLKKEYDKLEYLKNKVVVPKVIIYEKYNGMYYLLTESLKGSMLCNDYYVSHPLEGIKVLTESFNILYNIDYTECILDETIDVKLKKIEENINNINDTQISDYAHKKYGNKYEILKYLKSHKPRQIIGFTHGDMSLSNIFADKNRFSGFVDVADAGMSDIYYDAVICANSIENNYGKEYVDVFYESLGIEKNDDKTDYYKLLLEIS